MSFALSTYLDSGFDYVFFPTVVAGDPAIRTNILRDITAQDYEVVSFTLTCSEETLLARHHKRGDQTECTFFFLHQKPHPGDHVLNTDDKTVEEIVREMRALIDGEEVPSVALSTPDLLLRTVTAADIGEVVRMWEHPRETTIEKAYEALSYMERTHRQNQKGAICHLCLGVFEKGEPKKLIGWCGLDGEAEPGRTVLFYMIDEPHRGRGYATQCVAVLLRYAFEEMDYDVLYGGCERDNIASYRVMEKAGMALTGTYEDGGHIFSMDRNTYFTLHPQQ